MMYDIHLSSDGETIEQIIVTCLTAARPDSGEKTNTDAQAALTTEEHMAWITVMNVSQLGEVAPFEVPGEAVKFLR